MTAPRVTEEQIKSRIVETSYVRLSESTHTVCFIRLDNGYVVTGESACVHSENFDAQIGQDLAYQDAFKKLWPLFGFLLRERLHQEQEHRAPPPSGTFSIADVARITHEANRALCASHRDFSQEPWLDAPAWQRDSAINGVRFHLLNPGATPEQSHEDWMAQKDREGWTWGPEKNPEAKTHPCMVPYDKLPPEQRAKDHLFRGIVHALRPFIMNAERVN